MAIMAPASSIRRHILQAVGLAALCHVVSIFTVDSPKPIYHCPLDRHGLVLWTDENCYWSASYAEAREKFVSLGNRLKEQVLLARDGSSSGQSILDVLDVQSLSYDIAPAGDYQEYIKSLEAGDISSPTTISPEKDTIDALLLTVRIPEGDARGENNLNVIHTSGTHGVEGYVGSAVQIRFLHEIFLQNEKQLMTNLSVTQSSTDGSVRKVLLVHAVNPNGMRHHRRTNENNVDLNRNVLSEEMWTSIRKRDPNFAGYVDLDSSLNPFEPVDRNGKQFSWEEAAVAAGVEGDLTKLRQQDEKVKDAVYKSNESLHASNLLTDPHNAIGTWLEEKRLILNTIGGVAYSVLRLGFTNAKRGLVSAQYHKPSGLSYGGGAHKGNTWENSIFAVQHAINSFAGLDFTSASSRAMWIDVHTGLGKYGDYSILTRNIISHDDSPAEFDWIAKFTSLLERSQMGYGQAGDASVSAGYDQTYGFITEILCPRPHCFAVTQEFGTRPGAAVAVAFVIENKGYNDRGQYGHFTSWAFYPQRLSWRWKTLRGGMDMLRTSLEF